MRQVRREMTLAHPHLGRGAGCGAGQAPGAARATPYAYGLRPFDRRTRTSLCVIRWAGRCSWDLGSLPLGKASTCRWPVDHGCPGD